MPVRKQGDTLSRMIEDAAMKDERGDDAPDNESNEWEVGRERESNRFVDCQEVPVTMGFTHRPARKNTEAHRALELLEDYHAKLTRPQDKQLRLAIERVIRIFKSRLFQALLGK
ncbi:uncharacterized protein LOC113003147 [Solenopsis invicta]|uniref:uncharacterized protein LOC113003147 n=1 Tax=Solenopsis invicta TaxID=13686 RepID=UPI00193D8FFC|nr:uncharacterized protein LOC113003147 [Solenopsis invicta]